MIYCAATVVSIPAINEMTRFSHTSERSRTYKEDYDATDCPYCGCQNVLKKRYKRTGKCLSKE